MRISDWSSDVCSSDLPKAGDSDAQATMLPPTAAGGDYAVQFAAYDSSVSADTVVARLRDAQLPAYREASRVGDKQAWRVRIGPYATRADAEIARVEAARVGRSEEHTSELQSLMRISYAVFCLIKKITLSTLIDY